MDTHYSYNYEVRSAIFSRYGTDDITPEVHNTPNSNNTRQVTLPQEITAVHDCCPKEKLRIKSLLFHAKYTSLFEGQLQKLLALTLLRVKRNT